MINTKNGIMQKKSDKLKHELFLERRASEYLRQECDDLQNELQTLQAREKEIVTVANHAWEQQLYNVFEQVNCNLRYVHTQASNEKRFLYFYCVYFVCLPFVIIFCIIICKLL